MTTGLSTLDRAVQSAKEWLKDAQQQMNLDSQEDAYMAMRAVLHTLRNQLSVEEACDLASQLPLIIQGVYYEGWQPGAQRDKIHSPDQFYSEVSENLSGREHLNPQSVTSGAFRTIADFISDGQLQHVKSNLSKNIASLFPEHAKAQS